MRDVFWLLTKEVVVGEGDWMTLIHKKSKKIIIIFMALLIIFGIVTTTIYISNPLFATVFFSMKTKYQVTRVWGGNEDTKSVRNKEVLALFAGKKISRDDSLKELGNANGATLYLIHVKGDKNIVYYDNAPNNAIVSYQGKYYQIENPQYPIDFWFAK